MKTVLLKNLKEKTNLKKNFLNFYQIKKPNFKTQTLTTNLISKTGQEKQRLKQLYHYGILFHKLTLTLPPVVHGIYVVSLIIVRQLHFVIERFSSVIPESLRHQLTTTIRNFHNTYLVFWDALSDYYLNPDMDLDFFVDSYLSAQQVFSTFREYILQIQPSLNLFGSELLHTLLNEVEANVQRFLADSQDLILSNLTNRISVPSILTDEYLRIEDYQPITEVGYTVSPALIVSGMVVGGAILIRIMPEIQEYLTSLNWTEVWYWIQTHYRPGGGIRGLIHTFFDTQHCQHFQPGQPSQVPFSQNPVEWLPADDRANTTTPPTKPNTPNNNKVLFIVLCVVVGVLFFL